jgi:putative N6-adenine-specific DNA methylase
LHIFHVVLRMDSYQMLIKTLAGLEEVVAEELKQLGTQDVKKGKRAVYFTGTDEHLIKANLCIRSGLTVLVPIAEFDAYDENQLYREVIRLNWEDIFTYKNTFSVQATVSGNTFTHSKYIALKVKDAIADRFRNKFGKRPDVDPKDADYQVNIHINDQSCSLSLNASGTSLDKRGYRLTSNEAPINESLAAGIILKSSWNGKDDFYDPMAGSGTFGIEAALIAAGIPPGLNRKFGFERWTDFDRDLFSDIKQSLSGKITEPETRIYSRDLLSTNINIIAQNAERAGVADFLRTKKEDFFNSSVQAEKGCVFLNPPYGQRLSEDSISSFYKRIGDQLKNNYPNCEAWVISSDISAMKGFGLKPQSRERVFNGGLECTLNRYLLY